MTERNETRQTGELNRLLSSASHALRTPLSVVMLELGFIPDERARKIEADIDALGGSIRRTFLLLKLHTNALDDRSEFELSSLVSELVDELDDLRAAKAQDLIVDVKRAPRIVGSREAVRESIRGLIENALTYAPTSSRVRVSTQHPASLTIEDSGNGIEPEHIARASNPFGHQPTSGIAPGIGLALADATARYHGRQMRIDRSELGGARVTLDFEAAANH